ncbi:acetamidase/formamidase family protein [Coraliomargarita parva]|uniref:acetamidase/formamidase family protein n=1 Tax=Coraliomargarita parva TaxID=3014050 RepID=UPI0022B30A67|nr:acetamidase/formamidase family protein [Coraliomargarita parva]
MEHTLDKSVTYNAWDNSIEPRLEMESGDTILIEMEDSSDGQVKPGMEVDAFKQINFDLIHALTGPVAIKGAKPGDTLKIEILDYIHKGWAWQSINPEKCFLPGDFDDFYLHHWELVGDVTKSMPGITLALHPFCGIIGVQRAEPGVFRTRPPGPFGGNMDVKHLTAGSTLYLPVLVDGALLCAGDAHAAQGDGEVSINGLEAPMDVRLKISLSKDVSVQEPYLVTTPELQPAAYAGSTYHGFISSGPDIMECARGAVRRAIDYLMKRPGLSAEQAFLVCSAVLDLKFSQVVNVPHYTVTGYLPEAIFNS